MLINLMEYWVGDEAHNLKHAHPHPTLATHTHTHTHTHTRKLN